MHLERVEVLLVVEHVAQGVFVVLNFFELDKEYVIEFVEILFHVVNGYTSGELEIDGVNSTVKLALNLSNLRIVLLVSFCVLLHPELAIIDNLVHTILEILVTLRLFDHFSSHIMHLLSYGRLRSQHRVLYLL